MKKILIIQHQPNFILKSTCQIIELKRATKRKSAEMKITMPDELVEKLIKDNFKSLLEKLDITQLQLQWEEKCEEDK